MCSILYLPLSFLGALFSSVGRPATVVRWLFDGLLEDYEQDKVKCVVNGASGWSVEAFKMMELFWAIRSICFKLACTTYVLLYQNQIPFQIGVAISLGFLFLTQRNILK